MNNLYTEILDKNNIPIGIKFDCSIKHNDKILIANTPILMPFHGKFEGGGFGPEYWWNNKLVSFTYYNTLNTKLGKLFYEV